MNQIVLSICIATHNRGNYIGETLKSLLSQNLSNNIEIVILNSASSDKTEEIIKSFNSPLIKYYFHDQKYGVDIDYNNVVNYANGKYCWLFTDDDLLKEGSIDYVLNILSNNQYTLDYLVVNSDLRNIDMNKIYKYKMINIDNDIIFENNLHSQNDHFSLLGDYLSFIGCLIVSKSFWDSRNKSNYFGTDFIHVGVIFQKFYVNQVYFISKPLISIRLGNSNWTSNSFKIWLINWPNLIMSFDNFDIKIRKVVLGLNNTKIIWKIIYFRTINSFDHKIFLTFKNNLHYSRLMIFLIKIISLTPKFPLKIIMTIFSMIRNRKWVIVELWK
jgi:abequosyltransferase